MCATLEKLQNAAEFQGFLTIKEDSHKEFDRTTDFTRDLTIQQLKSLSSLVSNLKSHQSQKKKEIVKCTC